MFSKIGAFLYRIGSKRSPTKPSSNPRSRSRAFSVSGASATPARTPTKAGVASAPSTTLVFPLSPRPDNHSEARPRVLSPARRVRFSSGSSIRTTHSKDDYDRSPIVNAPAGATHEGTRSPSKLKKERERSSHVQKVETFPASFSSPNLLSASPEKRSVAQSKRERRPSLLLQSASRSFVSMAIAEEGPQGAPLVPMTRSQVERGHMRSRPKPRTRPSVDSSRAICGGVVGRGVHGPYTPSDEGEIQEVARTPPPRPVPKTIDPRAGESFLSLDYSDDEDVDQDMHTTMFVNGRRASDRTQRVADAFFTLAAEQERKSKVDAHQWETYGAAQTEGKRDRARAQRETRALLAAFPEPPKTIPSPLDVVKHRAIAQWARESAAVPESVMAVCDSAESSELGHAPGWSGASRTSTEYTTPEATPPRARPKRERPPGPRPYDARAPPAKSCPSLGVATGGATRRKDREKLLPLVPYDALEQPFRFERHPYASPALGAERW